jgi:phenylacetate-CoA ligase
MTNFALAPYPLSLLTSALRVTLHRTGRVLRHAVVLLLLRAVQGLSCAAATSPRAWLLLSRRGAGLSQWLSGAAAGAVAWRASTTTPALAQHYKGHGVDDASEFGQLPMTDKRSYVDEHDLASRCLGGRLPDGDAELDESAGTTGRAYTWVRSRRELRVVHRQLACLAQHVLRDRTHRDLVTLNAFSMGAWATGSNVSAALGSISLVKSCGPDTSNVLDTLALLGPDRAYVVCGYPPFVDDLLRAAERRSLDLSAYELYAFVGGEGMTEELRGRLERTFRRVWSAYGASDLDIGVAAETELSIAVRQAAHRDPALAEALFGTSARLPMVFQYDPSSYFVETVTGPTGAPELVVTVLRRLVSPRVRYAVHDAGGTLDLGRVRAICAAHGVELEDTGSPRMPLLFVHGRADATVSHLGANLYPEDVDAAVLRVADAYPAAGIAGFALELEELSDGRTRPLVHLEVTAPEAVHAGDLEEAVRTALAAHLLRINADWRAAATESVDALCFGVRVHAKGTGPFTRNATRIKRQYLI